jgi:hypothetical protein
MPLTKEEKKKIIDETFKVLQETVTKAVDAGVDGDMHPVETICLTTSILYQVFMMATQGESGKTDAANLEEDIQTMFSKARGGNA